MSKVIPPFPPHFFMAWTRTTITSHSHIIYTEYPANLNIQKYRATGQGDRSSDRQVYPCLSGLTGERAVLACTIQVASLFFGI